MADRSRFFDDLAGVAGGAFSAFSGLRDEAESTLRARADEMIRKLDLVKREEFDAVAAMAAAAREGQERAEARLAAVEVRLAALAGAKDGPAPAPAVDGGAPAAGSAAPPVPPSVE